MSLRPFRCRPWAHRAGPASHLRALALAGLLMGVLPGCAGSVGTYFAPTAAVVGGAKITEADVVAQFQLIPQANQQLATLFQGPDSAVNRLDAKRQVLTLLVRQQAVVEEARRMGIEVTDRDVQAEIVKDRQGVSPAAFRKELAKAGVTLDDLTRFERIKLTVNAASDAVTSKINATPEQIAAAYQAGKATYDGQIRVAHILICSGESDPTSGACTATPADLETAKSVDERALSGNDFAELARQYSVDAQSKAKGGDLGWVDPSRLVTGFADAVSALKPGEVTKEPVQTQFGYHVIKLIAKGRSLADASDEINSQLEQAPRSQAFNDWLRRVLTTIRIRINPKFGQFDAKALAVVAPPGARPRPAPTAP